MDIAFTTETVRNLFGPNISPIVSTYKCSHQRISGRLYIASNALCFYSNIFGFEKKFLIRIVDISFAGLTRSTSIVIRSKCLATSSSCDSSTPTSNGSGGGAGGNVFGMQISGRSSGEDSSRIIEPNQNQQQEQQGIEENITSPVVSSCHEDKELLETDEIIFEEEHIFKSFDQREAVLRVILNLMGKQENDDIDQATCTKSNANRTTTLTERLFDFTTEPSSSNEEQLPSSFSTHHQQQPSLRLRTYSDPRDVHRNTVATRTRGGSTPNWLKSKEFSLRVRKPTSFKSFLQESVREDAPKTTKLHILEDMKTDFESKYPIPIIQSYHIPKLTVDDFFTKFLHDDAQWSFQVFQQNVIKDQNIDVTPWQQEQGVQTHEPSRNRISIQQQSRSLSFLHPRKKAKIGPSTALTKKEQKCTLLLQQQSIKGIVLHSSTKFEGVPYCDCFMVEEKWIIEPYNESTSDAIGCFLSIRLRVNFIKSTMMKKIICNQTLTETKDWFELYIQFLERCMGLSESSRQIHDETTPTPDEQSKIHSKSFSILSIILLLLFGGIYYIYTLYLRVSVLERKVESLLLFVDVLLYIYCCSMYLMRRKLKRIDEKTIISKCFPSTRSNLI